MAVLEKEIVTPQVEADADAGWQDALKRRKQWTHEECLQLEKMGLLTEHYELLNGEIVFKMSQNMAHAGTVNRVLRALLLIFNINRIFVQQPIMLDNGRLPEPDAAVLAETVDTYSNLPTGADALLVVEVSDATLRTDRDYKMLLYARAGIAEYWIVNIPQRQLEVYRQPGQDGYTEIATFSEADTVRPLAAPDAVIAVRELLP